MLGEENERTIADALSAVLKTDKDPEVRSAVVIAMGKTGGLYSVERLLSLLKADRNPRRRISSPLGDTLDRHRCENDPVGKTLDTVA